MLVLPAQLTQEHAAACCRLLSQGMRSENRTEAVADASSLVHFDSSALAVLLESRREALSLGKSFAVRGMPVRLRELADLYGVSELLPSA
jgi:phospholipid transport system transporter-binding protein